jgi:quercetin dioxygenase-like cupin family protein
MKLHKKIRYLRKTALKISLKAFHEKLVNIFGDSALTYYSLCRIEKGYREALHFKSLYQISTGLGISLKQLKEDTEEEESKIVNIIRKKDKRYNKYIYNEKAMAEIISPREISFLAMELTLLPGGETKKEQDPVGTKSFEKLITIQKGEIIIHVGQESHLLKKGDTVSFKSDIVHYMENRSRETKARGIIIQHPKQY